MVTSTVFRIAVLFREVGRIADDQIGTGGNGPKLIGTDRKPAAGRDRTSMELSLQSDVFERRVTAAGLTSIAAKDRTFASLRGERGCEKPISASDFKERLTADERVLGCRPPARDLRSTCRCRRLVARHAYQLACNQSFNRRVSMVGPKTSGARSRSM